MEPRLPVVHPETLTGPEAPRDVDAAGQGADVLRLRPDLCGGAGGAPRDR
jgi:hypothetical protein